MDTHTMGSPQSPPVVHVVKRPTGFGRLVGAIVTGLSIMSAVFLLGIVAGGVLLTIFGVWIAGSVDETIEWHGYRQGRGPTIAIVPIVGIIDGSKASFVRRCVSEILDQGDIAAVIVRVDSPGGGVTPSDQIWYQLGRLKDAGLPVIASFGGVAASGGYYVACASDTIVAEETCTTGSIGVIAQILTLEDLMDKVGIEPITLVATQSPRKSIANDTFREWGDEDRAQVMTMLDAAYETFHRRVKDGRGQVITSEQRLETLTNGSVFTAKQALENGLVDAIGYLDDAIDTAEQAAGIAAGVAEVLVLQERLTLFGTNELLRGVAPRATDAWDAERVRTFANELSRVRVMYLMNAP